MEKVKSATKAHTRCAVARKAKRNENRSISGEKHRPKSVDRKSYASQTQQSKWRSREEKIIEAARIQPARSADLKASEEQPTLRLDGSNHQAASASQHRDESSMFQYRPTCYHRHRQA